MRGVHFHRWGRIYFSKNILLLNKIDKGFYVDVGACHPFMYSNTALLYESGWRGINIEPNPNLMKNFHNHRPLDVNVVKAISFQEEKGKITHISRKNLG